MLSMIGTCSSLSVGLRSFGETVAFHQHNAILRDLNELFAEATPSLATSVSHLSSHNSTSTLSSFFLETANLSSGEGKVCQVQFKHVFRHYKLPVSMKIQVGEFVVVQSFIDKSQEDLGVVTNIYFEDEFLALRAVEGPREDADENKVGKILRVASLDERKFLPMKFQREHPLLRICQTFVERNHLDMMIYGVEYQFDGNVLYVYYVSENRVDFRPLVKFLIKLYCKGSRIQMKKTNQCREFVPVDSAREALVTGKPCAVGSIVHQSI